MKKERSLSIGAFLTYLLATDIASARDFLNDLTTRFPGWLKQNATAESVHFLAEAVSTEDGSPCYMSASERGGFLQEIIRKANHCGINTDKISVRLALRPPG